MTLARKSVVFLLGLMIFFQPDFIRAEKLKVRVISENVYVRLKPDRESMLLSPVPIGTIFESEEKRGEWYQVSLPPDEKGFVVVGYIHSSSLHVISEVPVEKKPYSTPAKSIHFMPQKSANKGFGLSLKFTGGYGYSRIGEWNDFLNGDTDYQYEVRTSYTAEGKFRELHYGPDFSGELIVHLFGGLGIGFGGGYLDVKHGKSGTTLSLLQHEAVKELFTHTTEISARYLKLSLHYFFSITPKMRFFINAGAGYYFARFSNVGRRDIPRWPNWQEDSFDSNSKDFGYQGGFGLELNLSRWLLFFIEGTGRIVKIGGFSGNWTREWTGNITGEGEGILYSYELLWNSSTWYQRAFMHVGPLSGANYRNVHETTLDLTGVAVKTGIRIKLW